MEFQCFNALFYNIVILTAFAYVFGICLADDSSVDNDHLNEYPFCGKMSYPEITEGANARTVNTKDDDENEDEYEEEAEDRDADDLYRGGREESVLDDNACIATAITH